MSIEGKNTELKGAIVTTLSEITGIGNVYGRLRHFDQTPQLLDLNTGCGLRDAQTGNVVLQSAMVYPVRISVEKMEARNRQYLRNATVLRHEFEALIFRSFEDATGSIDTVLGFYEALFAKVESTTIIDRFEALAARVDPPEIVRIGEAYWGDRLCAQAQIGVVCYHFYG